MLEYRLQGSFAALSMFGSLLIILTFIFVKPIRKHPTSLILFLSLSDFFYAFKYTLTAVIPNSIDLQQEGTAFCTMQGIVGQFFGLSVIGWIGMISINLLLNLRNPFANTAGYVKWYHLIVWLYAIAATLWLALTDNIGISGDLTCWIKQDIKKGTTNWMMLTFVIPLVLYWLIALWALIYATARSKDVFQTQTKMSRSIMIRMRIFVLSFILCWSGPIVHRFTQIWYAGGEDIKWIIYWEAASVSLQGFINSLIWLTHPVVFRSFRDMMGCCWKGTAERVPLLGRIQSELDEQEDIQRMDVLMRKSIITCILLGLKRSVRIRGESRDNYFEEYKELYSTKDHKLEQEPDNRNMLMQDLSPMTMNELKQVQLNYLFKDIEPVIFEKLRRKDGISKEAYLDAMQPERFLGNLKNQSFSEGRSGSFFCFSPDKNFILKTIEPHEAQLLKKVVPDLEKHLDMYPRCLLNKLYGFHSVKIHGSRIFVIVMGNVFNTNKKIHEKYDLKFSWIARNNKEHKNDPSVLGKDQNLTRKLKLTPSQKAEFMKQVEADAKFLKDHGIMDYSLLVGFHFKDNNAVMSPNDVRINIVSNESTPINQGEESTNAINLENKGILSTDGKEIYFIGMIDILQAYNLNKKTERCFKIYFLRSDRLGLSVQPVQVYFERFVSRLHLIIQTPEHK